MAGEPQSELARQLAHGYGKFVLLTKEVTFNNTGSDVTLFTVTGDVVARLIAICKTGCASAGGCNVKVGTASDDDICIALTDVTLLAANEIWHDATPDIAVELLNDALKEVVISNGEDIVLDVEAGKQVDSGAITFYLMWFPLSDNGLVVAA